MEPIVPDYGPYLEFDHNKKARWTYRTKDNNKIYRARLIMMNFLHTSNLPKVFHVHHINGNTGDDRIENLQLMSNTNHLQLHHPRDTSKYGVSSSGNHKEYEKLYRADINNDPIKHTRKLKLRREARNKYKDTPEFKEKNCARASAYYNLHKDEQEFREKRREQSLKYYYLKKEETNEAR